MSHIEAGRTHVTEQKVRALAGAYGCTRHPLIDELVCMAASAGRGWWSEYKRLLNPQLLDLAELESTATGFRSFQWLYVPGLLQTHEYMHALFRTSSTTMSPQLLDRYVEFREERQQILTREPPPLLHAIIHEGVFHMGFIEREIMTEQLEYLIAMSEQPNVTVQILPFSTGLNPAALGAFTLMDAVAHELRTVYVEQPITSAFLSDYDHVEQFATSFERLIDVALAPLTPNSPYGEGTFGLVQYLLYGFKEGKRARN